mgnify:CR=1 FL=1
MTAPGLHITLSAPLNFLILSTTPPVVTIGGMPGAMLFSLPLPVLTPGGGVAGKVRLGVLWA